MAEPIEKNALQLQGFFSAVARLERENPEAARVGGSDFAKERIRFRHDDTLAFNPLDVSAIREVTRAGGEKRYELLTSFLGLTGGSSPTPSYMTEEVAIDDQGARQDFLDIFHHRLVSLLYRELARLKLWAEQSSSLSDPWSRRLFALGGLDIEQASPLASGQTLRLLPLLAVRLRASGSLAAALRDQLQDFAPGAEVSIREFAGGWSAVPQSEQTQLGSCNTSLGQDVLLGSNVRDPSGSFEIHVSALDEVAFQNFNKSGGALDHTHRIVGLWLSAPLEYRIVLHLMPEQLKPLHLGIALGGRLGVDSWLGRRREATAVTAYPTPGVHRERSAA